MAEETNTDHTESEVEGKGETVTKGDIITMECDTWIVNPDGNAELVETTNEELAKSEEIHDEKTKYLSLSTVVGAERVVQGLDNSFINAKIGEKQTVEIPPSEGAGDWDSSLVEVHSIREFVKQKVDPVPGMEVTFKNKLGTIVTVTTGRVRIDFNPRLAGKTVRYEYTIKSKAKNPEERALGIIKMDYGESDEFKVNMMEDTLEITLPEICKYDQNWFIMKYKIVGDLREHTDFKTIKFIEEYIKKEEEATPDEEPPVDEAPPEDEAPSEGDAPTDEEPTADEPSAEEEEVIQEEKQENEPKESPQVDE